MNIAIDITPLSTGHKYRGVGKYTKLLIDSLAQYERQHSYSFFVRGQKVPDNCDIVHYPYFDPFFFTLPLNMRLPTVVTVHDLIPLVFPDRFPPGLKGSLRWALQRRLLAKADGVITDSASSKKDIVRIISYKPEDIAVVHLASAPEFTVITDKSSLLHVQKTYGLPQHFLIYVGDVNWNKNIIGLVRAFRIVREKKDGPAPHLMLVGKSFIDEKLLQVREMVSLIKELSLGPYVHRVGYLPDHDLAALYTLASAGILPSFYEGFGLPVLEAMSCGCPVIASTGSSLDEIAGPSIRVDPYNTSDIAAGIFRMMTLSVSERNRLSEKSITWAKRFSWQKVAAETVAIYEKLVARD